MSGAEVTVRLLHTSSQQFCWLSSLLPQLPSLRFRLSVFSASQACVVEFCLLRRAAFSVRRLPRPSLHTSPNCSPGAAPDNSHSATSRAITGSNKQSNHRQQQAKQTQTATSEAGAITDSNKRSRSKHRQQQAEQSQAATSRANTDSNKQSNHRPATSGAITGSNKRSNHRQQQAEQSQAARHSTDRLVIKSSRLKKDWPRR